MAWGLVGLGAAALALALLFGGREERIFAAAKACALGGALIPTAGPTNAVLRDIVVDLALLAVILPLALRSNKAWPLAAASLCLAGLMTGAAQLLAHARPQAYAIVQGGWDLLAACVVAAGAWNVQRARRGAA